MNDYVRIKRPTTSWDAKVDPDASPLKGLARLDPPILITPEARQEAARRLETATRPYRAAVSTREAGTPPRRV